MKVACLLPIVIILGLILYLKTLQKNEEVVQPSLKSLEPAKTVYSKQETTNIPFIDPAPVSTGFLIKTPQCEADACASFRPKKDGVIQRYPITLPYVEYNCGVNIPNDAPCTEFIQPP